MRRSIILSLILVFITVFSISCNDQDFVVSADKPLRVTYISPSDGSVNIPLNQVITVKFSELVKESTVLNSENFYLENINDLENPVKVESSLVYDKENLSVTLTPNEALSYSSKYKVVMTKKVIKEDAKNSFGGELSIELASVFTTVNPDELYLVHSAPASSSWSVDIDSKIDLLFSLAVNTETVVLGETLIVEDISDVDNPVVISPADTDAMVWSEDNKKLVFTPKDIFAYSKTIRVTLTKEIKTSDATSKSGFLKESVVIVFKTIDPPMLGLTSIESSSSFIPLKVDVNGNTDELIFTFTEGLLQDSVRLGDTILIEDVTEVENPLTDDAIGAIDGSLSFNNLDTPTNAELIGSDNVLTFSPSNSLEYGALLRVTLKGENAPSMNGILSDRATIWGGQLPEDIVYLIEVEKLDKLYIVSNNVAASASVSVDTDITLKLNQEIDCSMAVPSKLYVNQGIASDPLNKLDNFNIICEDGVTDTIVIDVNDVSCTTGSFCYNEFYTVTLEGGNTGICVPDKNPNDTSDDGCIEDPLHTFTFKTEDIGSLHVVSTNVAGSASVEVDTDVTVKLNKQIDCSMAVSEKFYINQGSSSNSNNKLDSFSIVCENGLTDTIIIDANDASCTTGGLCYNESYTVTLEGGNTGICVPEKNPNDPSDDGCIESSLYSFTFKTKSLGNLHVVSTNAAGSAAFDPANDVVIVLSEEIDCSMAESSKFYINQGTLSDSANKVDSFSLLCENGKSDTITIHTEDSTCDTGSLCFNTNYTITIEGGNEGVCVPDKNINDSSDDGCIRTPSYIFSFKTMELPEFVANINPIHNSAAVSLAINPSITFSQAIDVNSVDNEVGSSADGVLNNICLVKGRNATDCSSIDVISVSYVYTEGDTVVTLIPDASLVPDTDYTVVVSRDIRDVNSRNLSGFYSSSFKTSPGGLLSHILVNNPSTIDQLTVEMFFTEDIDVKTLNNKTVYMSFINEFEGMTYVPGLISFNPSCDEQSNSNCVSAIFTPDFLQLFACGETSSSSQYELPLNTQFNLHLSSLIRNSDYLNNQLYVPISVGESEYIYNFTTKNNNLISSVKYSNSVVNPVNLNLSNEVPVNSKFIVEFERAIDENTLNNDTVVIEDARGDNASIVLGGTSLTVSKSGTFISGRDENKYISLFGTKADNGKYKILSVTDDKTVVLDLNTGVFNNTENSIYWRRTLGDDSLEFSVLDETKAYISLTNNLIHHVDYKGHHGISVNGTNSFTLDGNLENFKFLANRDIGKKIILSRNNNFNDGIIYNILSVNEATNTITLDGNVFTSSSSDIAWRLYDNNDYHRLIVKGRSISNKVNYLKEVDNTPIQGIAYYKFFTSPATYVTFTPKMSSAGDPLHQLENLGAVFNREVNLSSITEDNFYTVQNDLKRTGLITYTLERKNVAILIPSPALEKSISANLYINETVLDFRGNPIIPNSTFFPTVSNAPSTSALKCDDLGLLSGGKGPSIADGSVIKGNQSIVIKFGTSSSSHQCEILPTSINSSSVLLLEIDNSGIDGNTVTASDVFTVDNDVFSKSDSGKYLRTSEGIFKVLDFQDERNIKIEGSFLNNASNLQWELFTPVPYDVNFVPRGLDGDYAEIIPKRDMVSAKDILLSINTSKVSTVYLFSSNSILNYEYTVEELAPSLTDILAVKEDGSLTSIHSELATGIKSDTDIIVVFDEDIKMDKENFKIRDELDNLYDFSLKVENNIAILTPNQALKVTSGSFDYELVVENVKDRAGNLIANSETGSFLIENTNLSVISASPADASSAVSVMSNININFNEAIDSAKLSSSTLSSDGSFKVSVVNDLSCEHDIKEQVFGCISLNNKMDKLTFTPLSNYDFFDETEFNISLADSLSDKAGNTLVSDFNFSFDTIGGDSSAPLALCVDLLNENTETSIDIYFNKDLDLNSLTPDSVTVYEVESGVVVTGTVVITNKVLSFTPDSILDSSKVYGLIVSDEVTDLLGNESLVEVYRTFFNGSDL